MGETIEELVLAALASLDDDHKCIYWELVMKQEVRTYATGTGDSYGALRYRQIIVYLCYDK